MQQTASDSEEEEEDSATGEGANVVGKVSDSEPEVGHGSCARAKDGKEKGKGAAGSQNRSAAAAVGTATPQKAAGGTVPVFRMQNGEETPMLKRAGARQLKILRRLGLAPADRNMFTSTQGGVSAK